MNIAEYEAKTAPGNDARCGCLAGGTIGVSQLSQPGGALQYSAKVKPSIAAALIAPHYDNNLLPLGTPWLYWNGASFVVRNSPNIEQFATKTMLALKLARVEDEHRDALELIESLKLQQRKAALELTEESARREIAERSELSIDADLKFQCAAMREMDHRTKNTLQIVANLLVLQSRTASSGEARDALQEAYRRLLVLARLHELLLVTNDDSREVPMSPLFASLADALRQSFRERSAEVELRISVEPITFPESVAIPLALLANELITNAYKHAFPAGHWGAIDLILSRTSDAIILQVRDNGVGTASMDGQSGLGHTLVRNFSAQLKGQMVYSTPAEGAGVVVTVTISAPRGSIETSATATTNDLEAA